MSDEGRARSRTALALGWILLNLGAAPMTVAGAEPLGLAWTNNMLTISGPAVPGGFVKIWYLEAFCRGGSTHRDWHRTVIPHQTRLVSAGGDGGRLELETVVEPRVKMRHVLEAGSDEVTVRVTMTNAGPEYVDVQWFQPCMRVDRFTGLGQEDYWRRSFIFTDRGLTFLDRTRRTEEAWYRGGQVYVPLGVDWNDVNPRPLSPDRPVNGLIGAVSADGGKLLAMAWDETQELFQGVIVCLHNDPRVGGLRSGEEKRLLGKVYVVPNDPEALIRRYQRDFGDDALKR